MVDKSLKKLSRLELLELLVEVCKINDELQDRLTRTQQLLDEKTIRLENAGNIARAALEVNHIFEQAQKAADDFLDSVKVNAVYELLEKENHLTAMEERIKSQQKALEKLKEEVSPDRVPRKIPIFRKPKKAKKYRKH